MSNFPLYDSLYKDTEDKDISTAHKKIFIKKIASLDQDGHELVYALIKIYYLKYDDESGIVLPYNGKYVNKIDITFEFNTFPNKLKNMLYKFVIVHLKKMEDDKKMNKIDL
jgi:hypothetical protein